MFWFITATVLMTIGSIVACFVNMDEEEMPKYVAAGVLWPITLVIMVLLGIRMWMPTSKPGALTRKQRREIAYQKEMLSIDRARNAEHEKALRIIQGG